MKNNEQEQIEEMVSIMAASNNPFVDVPIEIMPNVAEALYNAGCRKLPFGAVVLLIGENNQALDEKTIEYFVKHNEQIRKEAVRDFAERLKNKLFEFFQDNEGLDGKISVGVLYVDVVGVEAKDGTIISLGLIDKLLKEYKNE